MKGKLFSKLLAAMVVGSLLVATASQAAVITLRSGSDMFGNPLTPGGNTPATAVLDGNVTTLRLVPTGSGVGDFAALTPAQFNQAAVGPAAYVVSPHPQWITPAASVDPLAQWVSVDVNGSLNLAGNPTGSSTALYAVSFFIAPGVTSAVLNMTVYADNVLGSVVNSGMFFNGVALAGTTTAVNTFTAANALHLVNVNLTSMLVAGWNTLYFDVVNTAKGPTGLMFSGTVTTTGAPVPVSGVIGLLVLGLLVMVFARGRSFRMLA